MFSHDNYNAFDETLLKEGISYVSSLFNNSYELIFLADRWFNSSSLMQHIQDLSHTYCIRLKGNLNIELFDKKEGHNIIFPLSKLKACETKSKFFENVHITNHNFYCNITLGKSNDVTEPWIIATNGDPARAIRDYGYRFGGIECVFKNQKSNGFYIESTVKANLKYFESMYTLSSFATLFLTILGIEYSKNTKCYKKIKITTHKFFKGIKKRVLSLFNTGLTLFNIAFNSSKYVRLPFNLILYDI